MSHQKIDPVPQPAGDGKSPKAKLIALCGAALLILLAGYGWSVVSSNGGGADLDQQATRIEANDLRALNDAPQIAVDLAARLAKSPDDPDGWALLARTYAKLGQHIKAKDAFQRALKLRDTDAGVLADYADTLAFLNNQSFAGEPTQLIERALRIDPNNHAALMLAGLAAFDQKQYPTAIAHWEKVVKGAGPTTQIGMQAQGGIDAAHKRAAAPH